MSSWHHISWLLEQHEGCVFLPKPGKELIKMASEVSESQSETALVFYSCVTWVKVGAFFGQEICVMGKNTKIYSAP